MSEVLHFKCHVPNLLAEIANHGLVSQGGVLKVPLNVLRTYLGMVAQRAIQLNDPELNILMLEMSLYDGTPQELGKAIEEQKKLLP